MRTTNAITAILIMLLGVFYAHSESIKDSEYKVETFNGVPFITVDGKPVRNRIVWVAAGGTNPSKSHPLLKKAGKWRDWEFEFKAQNNLPIIVQLRMGEGDGTILFSKFDIVESDSGRILRSIRFDGESVDKNLSYWCSGHRDNPPLSIKNKKIDGESVLEISIKADKKLDGFHIYTGSIPAEKDKKYKVLLRAKCDAPRPFSTSVYNYENGDFIKVASDSSTHLSQIRHAANAGVDFVSFEINSVWTKPGEPENLSYIDSIFRPILRENPNAKLIPRVRMDPQIHKWWRESHPDEIMKNSDGSLNEQYISISSPKYRREAAESLAKFIDYCEKNYPENMAGYHPAGGNSREWFYGGTWKAQFSGYDANTLKAWRAWLKRKYSSMENLKKFWIGEKAESFDDIKIPTEDERKGPSFLIDPEREWKIADFNFFLQDEMADMVLSLAKVIREHAPRRLSVFFFGYGFEFSSVRNGPAFSGHYGLSKILASKDVDAISGPISYTDRNFGECKTTMGATESITDAGKLWIDEDDTSTYLAPRTGRNYPGKYSGLYNLKDSREVLKRNLAQETVRNNGVWWMDLFGQGWFDDSRLWKEMKSFAKPERDIIKNPLPYRPPMRLVMDERSMCMLGAKGASGITTLNLMQDGRMDANRSGVSFGQYLIGDVLKNPEGAKLNVFLSIFALDSEQRNALKQLREKSANIWAWAPGYIDLDNRRFSIEAASQTSGFKLKRPSAKLEAVAFPTPEGEKIGLKKEFGSKHVIDPVFIPELESEDVVFAKYSDGSPAVVLRTNGKHPQLFCGVLEIPAELYRYMARLAGAHVYCSKNAAAYANGAYLSITATEDGEHEIDFGRETDIYNALTGNKIAKTRLLKMELKKGDCRFFRMGTGNAAIQNKTSEEPGI